LNAEVFSMPGWSAFLNTPPTGTEFSSDPTGCQKRLPLFKEIMR